MSGIRWLVVSVVAVALYGQALTWAALRCPGIPDEPTISKGDTNYEVDTVAGWVTFDWTLPNGDTLLTLHKLLRLDADERAMEVSQWPEFYMVVPKGSGAATVWHDQGGEGRCDDITVYPNGTS